MHKNTNKEGLNSFLSLSKNELSALYERCSQSEIANLYKISRTAVQNQFQRLGIKARSNAASQVLVNNKRFSVFSPQQEQMLYGSLLGDACLSYQYTPSNKTGVWTGKYKVSFSHSDKQLAYLLHKKAVLGKGVKCKKLKTSFKISGHGSRMYGFCFQHTPTLREVAKLVLAKNHKKRITPEWLDKLDWLGIAYWYQDDGCLQLDRSRDRRSLVFYTNSYSRGEINLLLGMLKRFGLNATTRKGNHEGERVITANRKAEVDAFLANIEPYIIPEMKYKVRECGTVEDWKNAHNYLQ